MKARLFVLGFLALLSIGCHTHSNSGGVPGYGFASARVPPPGTSTYSTASNLPNPNAIPTAAAAPGTQFPATTNLPQLPPPNSTAAPGATSIPTANPWQPTAAPVNSASTFGQPAASAPGTTTTMSYGPGAGSTGFGYQTTTSTAVADPTRMPAVDATAVRAPSGVAQASGASGFSPIAISGNLEYGANPQIVGAYPNGYPPGYPSATAANNANYVLAQASTKPMESDPNYRLGWRPVEGGTVPAQR